MEAQIEVETGKISKTKLVEMATEFNTCNGFSFWYMEQEDTNAVVRDATVLGPSGEQHCYVYDKDRDITIDVCFGQFDEGPDIGAWDGDEHPYIGEWDYLKQWEGHHEWDSRDEFEAHYSQMPEAHNPFYL